MEILFLFFLGLGGAVVITVTKRPEENSNVMKKQNLLKWEDPRSRFGYNPATEARPITTEQVKKVLSVKGGLVGTRERLKEKHETVGTTIVKPSSKL